MYEPELCVYDPIRDIAEVDQFGFIDLAAANASGSVPSGIDNTEMLFNGIDDPKSIAMRPRDQFEAMQANKAIVGYKPPKNEENAS